MIEWENLSGRVRQTNPGKYIFERGSYTSRRDKGKHRVKRLKANAMSARDRAKQLKAQADAGAERSKG